MCEQAAASQRAWPSPHRECGAAGRQHDQLSARPAPSADSRECRDGLHVAPPQAAAQTGCSAASGLLNASSHAPELTLEYLPTSARTATDLCTHGHGRCTAIAGAAPGRAAPAYCTRGAARRSCGCAPQATASTVCEAIWSRRDVSPCGVLAGILTSADGAPRQLVRTAQHENAASAVKVSGPRSEAACGAVFVPPALEHDACTRSLRSWIAGALTCGSTVLRSRPGALASCIRLLPAGRM